MLYYAKSTGGFYDSEIHCDNIPSDSVRITSDNHAALMRAQSEGKQIVADENGNPIAVDPPAPTADQLAIAARAQRDAALSASDWLVARHRDEADAGGKTTLTADQFKALLVYRAALRDLPNKKGFPAVAMPEAPDFL